jgi:hypothetical protein
MTGQIMNALLYFVVFRAPSSLQAAFSFVRSYVSRVMNRRPTCIYVFLDEYVLQLEHFPAEDGSTFDRAPEPLLPNYGVGGIEPYNLDINMMVALNSKERTLGEFVKLGEDAGLQFVKYWPLSDRGLVEYRLAQISQ